MLTLTIRYEKDDTTVTEDVILPENHTDFNTFESTQLDELLEKIENSMVYMDGFAGKIRKEILRRRVRTMSGVELDVIGGMVTRAKG